MQGEQHEATGAAVEAVGENDLDALSGAARQHHRQRLPGGELLGRPRAGNGGRHPGGLDQRDEPAVLEHDFDLRECMGRDDAVVGGGEIEDAAGGQPAREGAGCSAVDAEASGIDEGAGVAPRDAGQRGQGLIES